MLDIAKFFRFSWEWFEKKKISYKILRPTCSLSEPKTKSLFSFFQHKAYIPINPFSKLQSQAAQP